MDIYIKINEGDFSNSLDNMRDKLPYGWEQKVSEHTAILVWISKGCLLDFQHVIFA